MLDAGVRVLLAGGLSAVTIDAVVSESGVAATTIYRHFTKRRELVVALFTHLMPLPAVSPDPDPGEQIDLRDLLERGVLALATQLRSEPWGAAMPSLIDEARRDLDLAGVLNRLIADRQAVFARLIHHGVQRKELPPGTEASQAVSQLVGPVLFRFLITHEPIDDDFCRHLVDLFMRSRSLGATPDHRAT